VAAERGLVGGARVRDRGDEGRELVRVQRARDGLELGGRHGLGVPVGELEEAAVHALLQRLTPRGSAHGWRVRGGGATSGTALVWHGKFYWRARGRGQ
jgi:hypothetical protein